MDLETLITKAQQRYRTTPDLVADVLREAILNGVFKSGQSLRQDEIAAKFGVSRIPIREALRQLEGEGLIVSFPHRGAVVATLSREELLEICDIRCALETLAIRLAIPHITEETLRRAEEIPASAEHEKNVVAYWTELNWRFHSTLYSSAGRPRLVSMIKLQHTLMDRYLRVHVTLLKYEVQGTQEHRQILEACRAHDSEKAVALLEHHIKKVGELLMAYLQPEQNDQQEEVPTNTINPSLLVSGGKTDAG